MTRKIRLLTSGAGAPAFNLALDEALLQAGGSAIRFYAWEPPGLSLGYFQELAGIDTEACVARGFTVVRRPTGGGAIAHQDELTFSITDGIGGGIFDADVRAGYRRIHRAFAAALARLGALANAQVDVRGAARLASDRPDAGWLCFYQSSDLDLVAAGRKLLGSAQRRIGGRVLHHGSLPLLPNPITPDAASVASVLGRAPSFAEMAAALAPALAAEFALELVPGAPTADELAAAQRLVAEKYGNPAWTARR